MSVCISEQKGSRPRLTQKRLKEVLEYFPKSGIFIWKVNHKSAPIGSIAGTTTNKGYRSITIDGVRFSSHRLAWLYMEGYLPENDIDHIDRNRKNNVFSNLRVVSRTCNNRNVGISKNNKTGIVGVHWVSSRNYWRAMIKVNKKQVHIGCFRVFNDAVKARWEAEKKYGFLNCCTFSTAYQYLKRNSLLRKDTSPDSYTRVQPTE